MPVLDIRRSRIVAAFAGALLLLAITSCSNKSAKVGANSSPTPSDEARDFAIAACNTLAATAQTINRPLIVGKEWLDIMSPAVEEAVKPAASAAIRSTRWDPLRRSVAAARTEMRSLQGILRDADAGLYPGLEFEAAFDPHEKLLKAELAKIQTECELATAN